MNPMKAIREKCLDCSCQQPVEVKECIGLWEAMGDMMVPWQSNACMGGQWPCEYLDACWTYDLDREKMRAGGLVQVARLNKQVVADSQAE